MARQIGVSLISFFPTFFWPRGYQVIQRELGLDLGIQLLPIRFLLAEHLKMFNVMSFEGPWNCGRWTDAIRRSSGLRGDYPSLLDCMLFGPEIECWSKVQMMASLCPQALSIDTPMLADSLIELKRNMYEGRFRKWNNQKHRGVVLDTQHWREFPGVTAGLELHKLGGIESVRMVHLQLMSKYEVVSFLENDHDKNASLLKNFLEHDSGGNIPVIIEAHPFALRPNGWSRATTLHKVASRVEYLSH